LFTQTPQTLQLASLSPLLPLTHVVLARSKERLGDSCHSIVEVAGEEGGKICS